MSNALSVALVSRSNATGGGASRIAEELAEWLSAAGCPVVHYCAWPVGLLKRFQLPLFSSGLAGKLTRKMHSLTRRMGFNELVPAEYFTTLRKAINKFDVVHFHDLHSAISPTTIELCSRVKPVLFTAHDCSCFTGGCIYPLGCRGYLKQCGNCPQLPALGARCDFTAINLGINRRLAGESNIRYIFPSKWMREAAEGSLRFAENATVIPNGFRSNGYNFLPKCDARLELGIRDQQRVVLVAAHFLGDPRKGVTFALAAIQSVTDLAPLVIFVGIPPDDLEVQLPGIRFWLTGFVSDKRRLGLLFAASDVFLYSALEDNLPIMVQEALAAGAPVVGFAAGGVSEMVDDQCTGWLCAPGNQVALNNNLRNALTRDDLAEFSKAARESASMRFDVDVFGQRHLDLYKQAIE